MQYSLLFLFLSVLFLISPVSAINQDGLLLLSFKYSITSDPFSSLSDWNYLDSTPCQWNGVICMGFPTTTSTDASANSTASSFFDASVAASSSISRVISLVLPNMQLVGTLVPELGLIDHLRHLELSGNSLNGTVPATFFNATELRILSLSDNLISGVIPALVPGVLTDLQVLNLSANGLIGTVPDGITQLPNLTYLALSNNYLSGDLPNGSFASLEYLDLSSNLLNGSIPPHLGTTNMKLLNLSSNKLTGQIPPEFGLNFLANATIDLSFNSLTGQIPQTAAFLNQQENAFAGNADLCGKPLLKKPCTIPSTLSNPPNGTESKSPPAIAVMPKSAPGETNPTATADTSGRRGLRPIAILAIAIGDVAGIAILFLIFLYVYQIKKRRGQPPVQEQHQEKRVSSSNDREFGAAKMEREVKEEKSLPASKAKGLSCCGKNNTNEEETDESSESSSWSDRDEIELKKGETGDINGKSLIDGATLVTVDGESELEMETLLKASAYILGATGSSIVYKAVLSDGTAFAVRRIGESSCVTRFKDFDAQVKVLAKFKHPNLLRIRGFYWGADEKLLIHEYAVNGSLANISFNKKLGSSPFHMTWETRLRIARGTARGLSYLHEKKCVHGNIKPSNILLNADFDPLIADFGLERLMVGDPVTGFKPGSSARLFGSKRSMHSTSSLPDLSQMPGASPSGSGSTSLVGAPLPYHAPESLKNLKPNPKWDVYSFGVVLLELIAGRVLSEVELCQWNGGIMDEERNRILRMVDPALRSESEGREEVLLTCFKLGFSCCAVTPQKRPGMKDVVQLLERICATSVSTSTHTNY